MSVAAYTNRTVDYSVFRLTKPIGEDQLTEMALYSELDGGFLVTGLQKLFQRFLLLLLTKRGSIKHEKLRGTSFLADGLTGQWRTVQNFRISFTMAAAEARRQMIQDELPTDPDDERIESVILDQVMLERDQFRLWITIRSRNKVSGQYITPIRILPR